MKHLVLSIGLSALGLSGCVYVSGGDGAYKDTYVEEAASYDPDVAAIEAVVLDYFDGQGEASLERLQRAFDSKASMYGVVTDDAGQQSVRVWPMDETMEAWASNDDPVGAGRDGEVLSIDIVDGRLAVVTFRFEDRFYDAFTMVKVNGEWKIAAKTFVRQ